MAQNWEIRYRARAGRNGEDRARSSETSHPGGLPPFVRKTSCGRRGLFFCGGIGFEPVDQEGPPLACGRHRLRYSFAAAFSSRAVFSTFFGSCLSLPNFPSTALSIV